MKSTPVLLALSIASAATFGAVETATDFPFDKNQLAGIWSDSVNTETACAMKNWHFRYEFSGDNKRLLVKFDREIDSGAAGKVSQVQATILSATSRTITFRYDGEQRLNANGKPIEWQLAIVAPGIYRWHATDWRTSEVNTVVGIKCSEN